MHCEAITLLSFWCQDRSGKRTSQLIKTLVLLGILSAVMTGCDQGYSSRLAAREAAQKWSNQGRDYQYLHTPSGTIATTVVTAKMRFIRLDKLMRQYIGYNCSWSNPSMKVYPSYEKLRRACNLTIRKRFHYWYSTVGFNNASFFIASRQLSSWLMIVNS